jgi:steroid 5-alpha reductase family enzyme
MCPVFVQCLRVPSLDANSLVMFALGAVFFETIFQTGTVPFGVDGFWPILLVIVGVFVIAFAFLQEPRRRGRS